MRGPRCHGERPIPPPSSSNDHPRTVRFADPEIIGQAQVQDRTWDVPSLKCTSRLVRSPEFRKLHQRRVDARMQSNQWGNRKGDSGDDSAGGQPSRSRSSSAPAELITAHRLRSTALMDSRRRRWLSCLTSTVVARRLRNLAEPLLLLPLLLAAQPLQPAERWLWVACFVVAVLHDRAPRTTRLFTVAAALEIVLALFALSRANTPLLTAIAVAIACLAAGDSYGHAGSCSGALLYTALRLLCGVSVFVRDAPP